MRVTTNTFPSVLVDQLSTLAQRQNKLQSQAATGQRVITADDDPTAMRRILDLQSEAVSTGQFKNNIQRLREGSNTGYEVISALKSLSDRAGELATFADGTKSRDQLGTYAAEIDQILRQAVQLSNTQHRGDYLFAGTRGDVRPFELTTDADGSVTGVTYQGNNSLAESEIAEGVTLSTMTAGANDTGVGHRGLITDSRSGADFFSHLISLRDNLLAGDTEAIATTDRANLERDEENFIFHFGSVGAIQARLDAAESISNSRLQSLETMVSKEADADLAQTLLRLSETQNAYQAALQSGATILGQSLLDYLR